MNIMNLILSSCAFLLSASALLFNVVFNLKERKRNIRRTLTDTLNAVARINVEIANLKEDEKGIRPEKADLRRNYDFQRSTLMTEVEFLLSEKPEIITATDCALAAFTYNELRDFKKTGHYWQEAVARSQNPEQKQVHLRDYAAFLFRQGKVEEGRSFFNRALDVELKISDDHFAEQIETYLLWATSEYCYGYEKEFRREIDAALKLYGKIKNRIRSAEMKARIEAGAAMAV